MWKRLLRIERAERIGKALVLVGERVASRPLEAAAFVGQPALLVWPDGRGRELAIARIVPGEAIELELVTDLTPDGLVTGLVYVAETVLPDVPVERGRDIVAAKQAGSLAIDDGMASITTWPPQRVALDGWEKGLAAASLSRGLGALMGLAVGDALGTTNEFKSLAAPPFPTLATGPLDDVVGAGPFHLAPGEATDDTQMAAALAYPFVMANRFSTSHYVVQYLAWRSVAFDVGVQINQAIDMVRDGTPPERSGRMLWETRKRFPAGNGSLMRTAVIGVMLAGLPEARRLASFADSAITHFDPRCQLACAAFNASIAHALLDGGTTPAAMLRVAGDEVRAAAAALLASYPDLRAEIAAAELALLDDLAAACDDDPGLYTEALHLHKSAGFVRVAFRLAYWELLHADSFAEAVIDVANRGGDADTNAAITGALVGAYHGVDDIPAKWVQRVLTATGLSADGWDFHPRTFLRALSRGFGVGRSFVPLARYIASAFPEYGTLDGEPTNLALPALPLRFEPARAILVQLLERVSDSPTIVFTPRSVHLANGLEIASITAEGTGDTTSATVSACAVFLYLMRRDKQLEVPPTVPAPITAAIRRVFDPDVARRPTIAVLLELLRGAKLPAG